jgi:hypothetical protein
MWKKVTTVLWCLTISTDATAVDRVVGVSAPAGGATLVKRVHVAAGTEIARLELVSNDLGTIFPVVRIRRVAGGGEGETLSEVHDVGPSTARHRFQVAVPAVVFAGDEDLFIEVVLPATTGVQEIGTGAGLGAMTLNGLPATSYIGSTSAGDLEAIDADLCVTLLGPGPIAKAGAPLVNEPTTGAGNTGATLSVSPRRDGNAVVEITTATSSTSSSIEIYDVKGALVRALWRGSLTAGVRRLSWDRRDGNGHEVAAGVYFVVARVPAAELIRKTIVVH